MERKQLTPSVKPLDGQIPVDEQGEQTRIISVAQIRGLVRLLDNSDVSEIEVRRADEGIHLVLRKSRSLDGIMQQKEDSSDGNGDGVALSHEANGSSRQTIAAHLVGIFHPWLKPRGGALVAVGDRIKIGQLVGTIESLNVLNEVEATVSGRLVEVQVQDGQPVEYGQVLMTIDSSEVEV